jgi:hypothetical protein
MDNVVDSMGHDLYALISNIERRRIVEFINLANGEKVGQVQNCTWIEFCSSVTLTSGSLSPSRESSLREPVFLH